MFIRGHLCLSYSREKREDSKMKNIGMFVQDLYNEVEFWVPYYRLLEEGHEVTIIASGKTKNFTSKVGLPVEADLLSSECLEKDFDALVIPGGYAPDKMRLDQSTLDIVKKVFDKGRPVAAICHAGWVLASAGVMKGKKFTCYPSIKDDLINAGGEYFDEEVIIDGNLITSRMPKDLPVFCGEIIRALK